MSAAIGNVAPMGGNLGGEPFTTAPPSLNGTVNNDTNSTMPVEEIPKYPLTKGQIDEIARLHLVDSLEVEARFKEIAEACKNECAVALGRCDKHQQEIRNVCRIAFTNILPGRWIACRPLAYVEELKQKFESGASLDAITQRVREEKRAHCKAQITTVHPLDHPDIKQFKDKVKQMYDEEASQEAIDKYVAEVGEQLSAQLATMQDDKKKIYDAATSEKAKTEFILRNFLHLPVDKATPKAEALAAKWERNFHSMPLGDAVAARAKDLNDAKSKKEALENRLKMLLDAQAANNKAMAAKRAKAAKRAEQANKAKEPRYCCSEGCGKLCPRTGSDADLGCERCYAMKEKGELKDYSWFCSEECAVKNAPSHNATFHPRLLQNGA
jgi:hypothetical protein